MSPIFNLYVLQHLSTPALNSLKRAMLKGTSINREFPPRPVGARLQ